MLDLDIFDECLNDDVLMNKITENVHLPNNAADFFNVYLPYYMSVHTDIEISADKIDVANNFCKYVNLVYKNISSAACVTEKAFTETGFGIYNISVNDKLFVNRTYSEYENIASYIINDIINNKYYEFNLIENHSVRPVKNKKSSKKTVDTTGMSAALIELYKKIGKL